VTIKKRFFKWVLLIFLKRKKFWTNFSVSFSLKENSKQMSKYAVQNPSCDIFHVLNLLPSYFISIQGQMVHINVFEAFCQTNTVEGKVSSVTHLKARQHFRFKIDFVLKIFVRVTCRFQFEANCRFLYRPFKKWKCFYTLILCDFLFLKGLDVTEIL